MAELQVAAQMSQEQSTPLPILKATAAEKHNLTLHLRFSFCKKQLPRASARAALSHKMGKLKQKYLKCIMQQKHKTTWSNEIPEAYEDFFVRSRQWTNS